MSVTGGAREIVAVLAALSLAAGAAAAAAPSASASDPMALSGLGPVMPVAGREPRRRSLQAGISLTPSTTEPYWACPEGPCDAIVDPPSTRGASGRWQLPAGGPSLEGGGEGGGYDPQDLQSAYKIPTSGGSDQTIAIVDAYGFPTAEADLATYRERYGLSSCTSANGCFSKLNQKGEAANYPPAVEGWETESALDLDMASAACPACHIMLVEATDDSGADLGEAVDTAAELGATEISNSYGSPEEGCWGEARDCEAEAAAYDHPGVLITAAGGDSGYDDSGEGAESPEYPASLPTVVAVGGTSLHRASNTRGWSEEPWYEPEREGREAGGGSGCSRFPKPSWQQDTGCAGRMTDDVAAVGSCQTPVSVYNIHGWRNICGTSVSTPLVAAIEAHASEYARSLPGGDAFYEDPGALYDVTAGHNGECTPPAEHEYFCHAESGYDGPTGNGTPDGPLTLTSAAPSASTRPASAVTGAVATLNGKLDPQGAETTYRFEYGTSTSYGTSVPVPDAGAGAGLADEEVSREITELEAGTTYHYRLVASNAAGTSYGQDRAFTTAPPSVTGVQPGAGRMDGAETVTISGSDFAGATAVHFGAEQAESFAVQSESSIAAIAPAARATTVDVTVTTPAGTSATGPGDRFAYEPRAGAVAWGRNDYTLGNGTGKTSELPVEVSGLGEVAALAAGENQSEALLKSGRVMAWGGDEFGQLGDGRQVASRVPVAVCAVGVKECPGGPYLEEVSALSAGGFHSLALLRNGTVVAWGGDLYGSLGSTESSDVPVPVCVAVEAPCRPENYLKEVVAISAGSFFSLALLQDGTVVAWGENASGQLGDGSANGPESCPPENTPCSKVPVAVSSLSQVVGISAGATDGLALLSDGKAMSWGGNLFGDLGDGLDTTSRVPVAVCAAGEKAPCANDLSEVATVSAGSYFGVALLKDGQVSAWGANFEGQLGDGTTTSSDTPVSVESLAGVTAISSGAEARDTLALLGSGEVVSWGSNYFGSLGDGATSSSDVPVGVCATSATGPCPGGPYASVGGGGAVMASGAYYELLGALTPRAPTVVTGSVSSLSRTSATLDATVDPDDDAVGECRFEYGTSPAYGSSVPCSTLPGAGSTPVEVSAPVSGLSPTTTYYYRAVASNAEGTGYGAQQSFATPPLPEFGRCSKLAGKADGVYTSDACTKTSKHEDTGAYEWAPWPLANDRFSAKGATATFATVKDSSLTGKPITVRCRESLASGEYTGSQTMSVTLTFTGCSVEYFIRGECESAGARPGEVRFDALEAKLGFEKAKKAALDLFPVGRSGQLASFDCEGTSIALQGAVLAPVSGDAMSLTRSIKYATKKGKQEPERLVGGPREVLEMSTDGAAFEAIGLTAESTQTSEEAVEVKAEA